MTNKVEKIRTRILIPIAATLVLVLTVSMISVYWMQRRQIEETVRSRLDGIQLLFNTELENDAELYGKLIDQIRDDELMQQAWMKRDREELYQHSITLFNEIRNKHQVSHFYFIDLDRTCYLRVHNKEQYGDLLQRTTLDKAAEKKQPVWGIELGTFGTFTLRVVHPWIIDDQLVGYLEFGKEIKHLTSLLSNIMGVELFFAIDKRLLDREAWDEGMRMMGRSGDWDTFADFVIIDQTLEDIPIEMGNHLKQIHSKHANSRFSVSVNDKEFRGGFIPLIDAGDIDVGDIIVLSDVTSDLASLRLLFTLFVSMSIVLGGILFTLFYFYLGRVEHNLVSTHSKLKSEIDERNQAQQSLEKSEKLFRAVVDSGKDAMIAIDRKGLLFIFNQAAEEMFGFSSEEMVGQSISMLIPGNFMGKHSQAMKTFLMTKQPTSMMGRTVELSAKRSDGSLFPIELSLSVGTHQEGMFIVGTIRDITARKNSEENIHTLTQQLIMAQESERRKIALDLHDNLAQNLSASKIACDNAINSESTISDQILEKLKSLSLLLQDSISVVRQMAYELRPPGLDQLGISNALFSYCEDFSENSGIKVVYSSAGLDNLEMDFETEINLFRIVQEALNNIRNHADAEQVSVKIVATYPNIILRIEDDGVGFNVDEKMEEAIRNKRMGLQGMRERTRVLQGEIRIESIVDKGTKIFIEIPLREKKIER
ncbi:MAG: PAS domain S-box protein [Candidatus Electryonea clarkiae]|nr:PAS domain S-box protein [Candidatus Electryonea clarkiae]MDP8287452.1 PAS domain S-box protein [Candidatus Electryonea clarkiae]